MSVVVSNKVLHTVLTTPEPGQCLFFTLQLFHQAEFSNKP